jgi:hypothetical protein
MLCLIDKVRAGSLTGKVFTFSSLRIMSATGMVSTAFFMLKHTPSIYLPFNSNFANLGLLSSLIQLGYKFFNPLYLFKELFVSLTFCTIFLASISLMSAQIIVPFHLLMIVLAYSYLSKT